MTINITILQTLLITLFSALIGGYVSFYFTSRSRKDEAVLKFREEKYSNLLILLKGFVGNTANTDLKRLFFDEQYKSWIYSSDEVVLAINELVELVKANETRDPDVAEGRRAIGNIVLAMRKDLLKNTKLQYQHFTYTNVRDKEN
ncbi:hypothetical protein Flavo103_45070 [Flavobacterium collinsii]|jgi:hypothetical protein|uniref:hypothetical protein n=1 Tax=Flavobacterium collinsii TaxID=1114861 RepID=UPI0022C188D6|nr:hypothetical protein [Flavobacterium collinsii]GIQ61372.1 hypothetical protein Flavo103_45070 [Flavobacterium collinsii]